MGGRGKRCGMAAALVVLALFFGAVSLRYEVPERVEREENPKQSAAERIVVTYQTLDTSRTKDLAMVVDAINQIAREEIDVEIELKTTSALDTFTDYPLWISQGEQVDLMILNYQDITDYISRGMLLPLDFLLESDGKGIAGLIAGGQNVTQGAVIDGKTYGVINVPKIEMNGGGIWLSEKLLEEIGAEYDRDHIYTWTELDLIFAALKERYPDSYPLGQLTADATTTSYLYYGRIEGDISGTMNTGVLIDGTIRNFYETDDYYDFLLQMREWYQKGYIYPDAAFTDESLPELYACGRVLSKPLNSQPGMADDLNDGTAVCLKTTPVERTARNEKSGFWVIPASSRNPKAAMKFLNLMLTDTRIGNLFKWGIEGVHYVRTDSDADGGSIAYPDGADMTTVGYYNPMALYGDYTKIYTMDSKERREEIEAYVESAVEQTKEYADFAYDKTAVSDKIAAVEHVIEKYVPVLESGSVDIDMYYPRFLEALEQAGMGEIIADKQAQFDRCRMEEE